MSFLRNENASRRAAPGLAVIERLEDRQLLSASTPLVNIEVLASTSATGTFTNSLTVKPGEKIYIEVLAKLAKVGTTHVKAAETQEILHRTAHPGKGTLGYDGIGSLSLNLLDSGVFTGKFSAGSLANNPTTGDSFNGFAGATAGTISGAKITGVDAIQAPGRFAGATGYEKVLKATFTVGAKARAGSKSVMSAAWGAGDGAFAINSNPTTGQDATKILITPKNVAGLNPYVSFASLTLTTAPATTA